MEYRTISIQVEPDPDAVEVRERRGEKYLVAPVVAVAEGVLNGGFLPFREIQQSAPGWNGEPVTVNHPTDDDGNFVPANVPDVLEEYQIGEFLNVEADQDGKRLTGELWINLGDVKWLTENTSELGSEAEDAVQMLRDGDPLEVSVGYWHGAKQDAGEFQGVEYDAVQVDVMPDHIAVLPNAEGACNWEGDTTASGCGAPRTNADGNGDGGVQAGNAGGVRSRLGGALLKALDVDPSEIAGEQDASAADVTYAVNAAKNCDCGSASMGSNDDPTDRLQSIADASTFTVDELDAMDDETVDKIEESLTEQQNGGDGDGSGDGDGGGDDLDPNVAALTETVDSLQGELQSVKEQLDEQTQERRDELVDAITDQTRFDEDDLDDLGILEDVDKLERFAEKQSATVETESSYAGRAAGVDSTDDEFEVEIDGYWANDHTSGEEAD